MDRKKFLKNGMAGIGSIIAIPTLITSCSKNDDDSGNTVDAGSCVISPVETAGPFPIKTPTDLVKENIIGDRTGIPLKITIQVQNVNNNCGPLAGVFVDIWQCDAKGNYSEYSGQLDGDFTSQKFLRGRQTTDANGNASFISIYPGWYPGRAPHLHLEILKSSGESLLITQVAFPENISKAVYATTNYKGDFDTSNTQDGIFSGDINRSIANSVTGNTTDGYILTETIKVSG
ncbi:dioxygenase family protein [Aquimarina macrocephali]|uniref:dioxygenase family protein n=1 Tax=Aquimarina macrocephali TaxID=666563 RepID=UPI0004646414|nr:intradiol ring-cleavage dioxygenase [Aquimarina macrocephali]